ncbi:hypothetical protein Csa_022359 [Cucumis sativus]|nr:hypothetical protein Csa_022359 [Cucumis sativus]
MKFYAANAALCLVQFKQCAAYLWVLTWGLRPIPEISYALLPPYCLINNSSFFPTMEESNFHPNSSVHHLQLSPIVTIQRNMSINKSSVEQPKNGKGKHNVCMAICSRECGSKAFGCKRNCVRYNKERHML